MCSTAPVNFEDSGSIGYCSSVLKVHQIQVCRCTIKANILKTKVLWLIFV